MKFVEIEASKLKVKFELRKKLGKKYDEFAESIKEKGIEVPLIINEKNEVIAGSIRLAAAKRAGLETVPCVITKDDNIFTALTENIQRKNMEWYEEALAFKRYCPNMSYDEIANKLHVSKGYIADRIQALEVLESCMPGIQAVGYEDLDMTILVEIHSFPRQDWAYIFEMAKNKKYKADDLRNVEQHADKIRALFEEVSVQSPDLFQDLFGFYFPLRYQLGVSELLEEEIELRTSQLQLKDKFLPKDEYSEVQATEYAIKHHSKIEDLVKIDAWHVVELPYTIEELREKLKDCARCKS
jgi:ParB/RepB/Spo0J family partition protein